MATEATPAAEQAARERERLIGFHDPETMNLGWSLRLMRAGAALLVGFEIIYFVVDFCIPPPMTLAKLALHTGAVSISALVLALTRSEWFERNWRPVCFSNLVVTYGLTLALRLLSGDTQPLFITLVFTLIGAGALLPWSARWQLGLSAVALIIAVAPASERALIGPEAVYRWVGLLIAVALGHFILLMRERYRAEVAGWMDSMRASRQELADALARSATIMAEREMAERRLREGEAMLRKLFDAAPDNIAISRMSDGAIIEVNHEFLKTGYTREELFSISTPKLGRWSRPQLRELVRALRAHGAVRNFEAQLRNKDGRMVPTLISATMVDLGGEQCVIAIESDITELKETQRELTAAREALSAQVRQLLRTQDRLHAESAERELAQRRVQESEQTLRRIFEASLDVIAINRWPDLTFVDLNERHTRVFGIPKEQALAAPPRSLRLWAQPDQFRRYLHQMTAHGFVQDMEIECVVRDGSVRPFLYSSALVELNGQQCAVSTLRDISQLKHTERELIAAREAALAASEAKSHFLSVMSHEIRTPMNAILGMADLLWETPISVEQRRYLDTMRNNGISLLNLVNGILDLSKVESGRLSLERVDFDLVELAEDVMETLGARAHEKGLELALRIPATFPTALTGDPLRLRQILINLLGNAIKFTERGEVTLTIDAADDVTQAGESSAGTEQGAGAEVDAAPPGRRQPLRFTVCDTGIGIPLNRQQAIFSNFIQADSATSRKYGGSGLGLTIVKRLVELMNGEIALESHPREGSSFSFTIALELQSAGVAARPRAPTPPLIRKQVLVVDDSPASRTIVAELLELAGAEVVTAADGAAAIAEIARARAAGRPYNAVVADNRMPAPDGAAIGQQVMGAAHTPREALVLMLTANDLNLQLARLRECGLEEGQRCRYLLKPVRRADLWATLAAACAGAVDKHTAHNGAVAAAATVYATRHEASLQPAAPRNAAILVKRPLRILLAEDSPDNRLLVEAYLKDTPYHLEYAENGESAVRKFTTSHYDAILMDIQMPVMDGYEAAAEIRRLEQSDHRRPTPIIVLTASAQDEAVRRSLKMGCDAHVTKPVKRSTLLEAIRDAVEPASRDALSAGKENGAGGAAATVSEQPIVVRIEQDLSDLVPGFLTRKREDARAILAAAERRDSEAIARLGHKMKGEGGSYGFDTITDLGREIEQAGKESDFEAARRLGINLMNFLERLEVVYLPMEN
ncbi:MAG TPA: response regulator [Candidatus Binataceae bacterium]|nr:response regulator [Candidatus Binataceae bacterium]